MEPVNAEQSAETLIDAAMRSDSSPEAARNRRVAANRRGQRFAQHAAQLVHLLQWLQSGLRLVECGSVSKGWKFYEQKPAGR